MECRLINYLEFNIIDAEYIKWGGSSSPFLAVSLHKSHLSSFRTGGRLLAFVSQINDLLTARSAPTVQKQTTGKGDTFGFALIKFY